MNELIILCSIVAFVIFLYWFLKPYFLRYDNSILFTGGIGSGKSLNSVKTALKLYKKQTTKVRFKNFLHKLKNEPVELMPKLYSNMPIKVKKGYCCKLTKEILTLKERIPEYSVVVIDELSAIVNQYNWNEEEVKYHLNEFIQFFRHYVGGYLIVNAQAESEIVKQVRTKLNSYFWCFDFQKFLFFFYRVRILHCQITENTTSLSTEFIEDNTKWTYGILTKLYDSRYLSERYKKIDKMNDLETFKSKKENKVIRFVDYESRCD